MGMGHIVECLDQFLIQSSIFLEKFHIDSFILPSQALYHKLIMITLQNERYYGIILFRLNTLLIQDSIFMDIIE